MLDASVRYYDSTMAGAPALSGTPGALISVLDACLKDGFGTVTLNSLVVAGNVATGTVNAGHGFTMVGGAVGPVITIAGATPAGLNGTWRIASVPNSTTFTFATSGIADQTATGTITAKRAPLGFSKVFSGTNKAVYRADDVASSRLYLRVADDGTGAATYARVRGFETMSDVDTGTGPYPTDAQYSGGMYWGKSSAANSTARAWRLIGDSQGFALFVNHDGAGGWISGLFVDIASEKAGDAYRSLLIGSPTATVSGMCYLPFTNNNSSNFMARSYTQTGSSVAVSKDTHRLSQSGMGAAGTGNSYPSPVGNQFYCAPVDIWETGSLLRGILPGIYSPLHTALSLTDGAVMTSVEGLPGRSLLIQRLSNSGTAYAVAIDITGPWR